MEDLRPGRLVRRGSYGTLDTDPKSWLPHSLNIVLGNSIGPSCCALRCTPARSREVFDTALRDAALKGRTGTFQAAGSFSDTSFDLLMC